MDRADRTRMLGSAPVGRLFAKLAAPAVLCQVAMMVNNVIDRAWVGHIPRDGMLSLGAVGLSLPIQTLFASLMMMVATGMAPTLSIMLGKGDRPGTGKVSGACFGLAIVLNLAVCAVLVAFSDGLLLAFGAGEASLPFARSYLRTLAWGLPFSHMLVMLTMWFSAQGYVIDGVKLNVMSVAINAVLDPVCIYLLGWGVAGAALATNVGAIIALAYGVRRAVSDARLIRFSLPDLLPRWRHLGPSVKLGLSTFSAVFLESSRLLLFNAQLQRFGGDVAISAVALLILPSFIVMSLCMGLSMGAQPIIGYNYGKGDLVRVVAANRCLIWSSFAVSLVLWLLPMAAPGPMWRCISGDADLVAYTAEKTRIFLAVMLFNGIQYAHLYIIRFLGQARMSLFLSLLRRLGLLIPAIVVFPLVLDCDKVVAVLLAMPVSELLAFMVTAACYFHTMRRLAIKGAEK